MTTLVRGFNDLAKTITIEKKKINILNLRTKPIINLIMLGLLLVILVFYLVEINQIVTLGFKVDELEKSRDDLKKTNKNLEMEKMQLESLNDANQELSALNFVKIDKIDYLRPMAGSTLTKK